jgi:hypothetical protein
VFVGWGEVPRVSEFDRSGRIVFDALLGEKYECYRAFRLAWTGIPAEAPAIALSGAGRTLTAYASWNGASEVRGWQLLAGDSAGAQSAVTSVPSSGFETALPAAAVAMPGAHVAVQALDGAGAPLGRSRTLSVA